MAAPQDGALKTRVKKVRLNLLIDKELKDWARGHAVKKHTNLTQLIVDHFVKLRDEEK